jgi:hypothetical protein
MTAPTGPPANAPMTTPAPTPAFSSLDAEAAIAGDDVATATNKMIVTSLRMSFPPVLRIITVRKCAAERPASWRAGDQL